MKTQILKYVDYLRGNHQYFFGVITVFILLDIFVLTHPSMILSIIVLVVWTIATIILSDKYIMLGKTALILLFLGIAILILGGDEKSARAAVWASLFLLSSIVLRALHYRREIIEESSRGD